MTPESRTVEPKEMAIARQQQCKHAPAVTNMQATTEEPQEAVFSIQSTHILYNEDQWDKEVSQKSVAGG
jgi:hypothetical protein